MADEHVVTIRIVDKPLLMATVEEYAESVEEGRMTEEEALDNLEALTHAMIVLEEDSNA